MRTLPILPKPVAVSKVEPRSVKRLSLVSQATSCINPTATKPYIATIT